jgi:iron-sulfur cluster assembly protein/iron-sulfur cluster insertion protein
MNSQSQTLEKGPLSITESAAEHIREIQASDVENKNKHLRIYIESGGCSGMQYGMVFDEIRPDDVHSECHGVTVLVDLVSIGHLRGAVVDYKDELNDSGFKITNPNAKESCGCGRSFN